MMRVETFETNLRLTLFKLTKIDLSVEAPTEEQIEDIKQDIEYAIRVLQDGIYKDNVCMSTEVKDDV